MPAVDRESVFNYNANESRISMSLRFVNTVLPLVLRRFEFWAILVVHVGINALYYTESIPGLRFHVAWTELDWNQVMVITSITTFFEVFYLSECFKRYLKLHRAMRAVLTALTVINMDMRLRMRTVNKHHCWLCARYMTAACFLVFAEVDPAALPWPVQRGSDDSSGSEQEGCCPSRTPRESRDTVFCAARRTPGSVRAPALRRLVERRLLREDECRALTAVDSAYHPVMLLQWALEVLAQGYKAVQAPPAATQAAIARLLKVHSSMRELIDMICLPVPFQYFHLLNLMVCANLLLWAYIMGATAGILSTPIFVVCMTTFMAMTELASQLSNPFTSAIVNFPVARWLEAYAEQTHLILESKFYGGCFEKGWDGVLERETRLGLAAAARGGARRSPR